jgi:hypothetical protein
MAKRRFSGSSAEQGSRRLSLAAMSEKAILRQSKHWPLLECLITEDWENSGQLVQICVARRAPSGEVAVGVFLMDLACLGAKNAHGTIYRSVAEYRSELRERIMRHQTLVPCDLDLAAKVVAEGVEYAASLGFKPNRDIDKAYMVLGDAHPERCDTFIPLGGDDGKPFFVNGPYDDVERILRVLDRKVGKGNYNFLFMMGDPDDFGDFDDEEWDEKE